MDGYIGDRSGTHDVEWCAVSMELSVVCSPGYLTDSTICQSTHGSVYPPCHCCQISMKVHVLQAVVEFENEVGATSSDKYIQVGV